MKILHLTNHALEIGNGIVNVAVDLAYGQSRAGHEVHFGSEGGEYVALLEEGGVRHHHLAIPGPTPRGFRGVLDFVRTVRKVRPDIVHSHMVKWAATARMLSPFLGYRTVSTIHNVYQKSSRAMGLSDGVVALGEASRQVILGWGVPAHRIHVVLNAPLGSPRLAKARASSQHAGLEGDPSIVSIGGLFVRKGFGPLIEAMRTVRQQRPNAVLHIVGEGPDRPMFEAAAAEIGDGAVRFHGFQANPMRYLAAADVVVLASFRESFPLVLLEAREFGAKIVATDVDGNREALDGGAAGHLVEAGNPIALADGILRAFDAPAPAGVAEGLDRFRIPALVDATEKVYGSVLKR